MIKEINRCAEFLEKLLGSEEAEADWQSERRKLLTKIKFFQHERLVHLIVTMTMSLLTIITAFAAVMVPDSLRIAFAALFVLFLALTAAYLWHYYKLENGVQKLYTYYNRIEERERKQENVQGFN